MPTTFAHPHIRIRDIAESLDFYCGKLGLIEVSRQQSHGITLIYLAAPGDVERGGAPPPTIELAHSESADAISDGTRFAHLAFHVDDLEATCARLADRGVTISVPPQPLGYAYVLTPDGMTIELLRQPD